MRTVNAKLFNMMKELPLDVLEHCLIPVDKVIEDAREKLFDLNEAPQVVCQKIGKAKVWGDGSCRPPTCRSTRRSAFAVHTGDLGY